MTVYGQSGDSEFAVHVGDSYLIQLGTGRVTARIQRSLEVLRNDQDCSARRFGMCEPGSCSELL